MTRDLRAAGYDVRRSFPMVGGAPARTEWAARTGIDLAEVAGICDRAHGAGTGASAIIGVAGALGQAAATAAGASGHASLAGPADTEGPRPPSWRELLGPRTAAWFVVSRTLAIVIALSPLAWGAAVIAVGVAGGDAVVLSVVCVVLYVVLLVLARLALGRTARVLTARVRAAHGPAVPPLPFIRGKGVVLRWAQTAGVSREQLAALAR